jgi:hypothetical protein
MKLKHNHDKLFIPDKYAANTFLEPMTVDKAIEVIQRNERGRQGKERSCLVRELREKERQGRLTHSLTCLLTYLLAHSLRSYV